MLRNRLNNRIRDEMDVDSSEDSDDGDYSADSDDDHEYLPENNENNCDSDDSDASETTEIENVEQEVLEHLAVHPEDGIRSCVSAFLLFIQTIENIVLTMTNLYGVRKYGEHWETIDMTTLHAYFGLLLLAGVYRSYGECITQLWDENNGRQIFRKTMSIKMFKKIQGCIRFDDKSDRPQRSVRDKLAPIRNVFDKWNNNLKTLYTPNKFLTVDEQLIPFRGRCPFRQYIPSKPAKYGIKMWFLCDSQNYYAYNTQVYVGRDRNCRSERNQGQRVVLDLCEGIVDRNVTCDNFFTSYKLAEELQKQHMTIVGTIRKNRVEIPPTLVQLKRKPVYSTEFVYEHKLQAILLSYIPKKNRSISLLSTYHNKLEFEETEKRKPSIISFYNKNKFGVDIMDQMVGTYRCKRKVNRWPMALFCNLLDVSACNAYIIYTSMFPEWNATKTNANIRRRLFLVDVGNALVQPQIDRRRHGPRFSSSLDAPSTSAIQHLPANNKRGRCYVCTYKNNRNMFISRCDRCKNFLCNEHKFNICSKCALGSST